MNLLKIAGLLFILGYLVTNMGLVCYNARNKNIKYDHRKCCIDYFIVICTAMIVGGIFKGSGII